MNQQKEVEDDAEEDMIDSFKDAAIHLMPSNAYSIFIVKISTRYFRV